MGWEVKLSGGGSGGKELKFKITPLFDWSRDQEFNLKGIREGAEISLPMRGWFEGTDPGDTMDQWLDLWDLADHSSPLTVEFILDGTTKKQFSSVDFRSGPYVRSLRTVPGDNNFDGAVEFELEIFGVVIGKRDQEGSTKSGRTVQSDYFNDRLIRKIWRAQARGGTKAIETLRAMEPDIIKEMAGVKTEIRQVDEDVFEAEWSVEVFQDPDRKIRTWTERYITTPAGGAIVELPVTGKAKQPNLIRGRFQAMKVVVEGEIESTKKDIPEPDLYLDEKWFDPRQSIRHSASMLSDKAGIYRKSYKQVFVITENIQLPLPVRPKPIPEGFNIKDEAAKGFLD